MSTRAAILAVGAALPDRDEHGLRVREVDPELGRAARLMSRSAQLAATAIRRCLRGTEADPARTAAFFGVGPSTGEVGDIAAVLGASLEGGVISSARFASRGVAACNPLLTFQLMNNFTLCHAAIREGLQGPNGAFFNGARHAAREGLRALEEVPWVIIGGADATSHPLARQERAGEPHSEAAVALLLAREADRPLAWVELSDEPEQIGDAEVVAAFGDCGAAAPALAWHIALYQIINHQSIVAAGLRLSRATPRPRPRHRASAAPVITGAGAVSPFGLGLEALHDGLLRGQSAARPPEHLPGFPPSAALPPGLDPLAATSSAQQRARWEAAGGLRDRRLPMAVGAAGQAWEAAGRPEGLALSVGLGLEQALLEDWLEILNAGALAWPMHPTGALRFRAPLDLPVMALAERLPLSGPRLVHASACASGALAVASAAEWVASGEADAVLCGAADSMLNPLGLAGLKRLGVISPRGVCRPFDKRRDGVLVGEGAAFFVVEREDAALARGVRPLARVLGWGSTQDGYAPTAPRPGGGPAAQAMRAALRRAGLPPERVGYINAHGTGTPPNDEAEAAAIRAVFPDPPPTGSFKGAIGHGMAAAGALELAGCLVAFTRGWIPGTAGLEREDEALGLRLVHEASPFTGDALLSNSFGFGGQNGSVILGCYHA